MINYIKNNPISTAFSAVFVLAFGITTFFLTSSNRDLRKENREAKRENKVLHEENKMLHKENSILDESIAKRDHKDSVAAIEFDSLKTKLANINKHNIVTTYENYSTVTDLDLDGDIKFLSGFIERAQGDTAR